MKPGKLTLPELAAMKSRGEKIVMVTAYDAPGARLAEQAGIDILLVGDTAGMVVLGHEGTVPVTMDEMLFLTRTVARSAERPLVVGDMPFGSYHVSDEDAVRNAIRFVKEASADVVKLEGAGPSLSRVKAITSAGMGVMGHVGLTPQSETILGGFKTQGRTASKARQLLADALALEAAGCFAVVLEAVPVPVAARITEALTVPTIGIGAGGVCDGQVLVYHDLLGLTEGRAPRFVKRYANLAEEIRRALTTYAEEVRGGVYPAEEHTYAMPEDELELFSESFGADDVSGAVAVRAAGTEEVAAVDRDPDGPVDEQRKRDRRRGEGEHMARAAEAPAAPEPSQRDVEDLADDKVEGEAVEAAREEGPDGNERGVDLDVIEQPARNGRGQDAPDSGEPDQRAGDVLPRLGRFVRVVTQRGEDGARALQHE